VSRSRTLANQIAQAEARAKLLRAKDANASASSMSNLEALVSKPVPRAISSEVQSLERKVAELERSYAAKLHAAKNFEERRAPSREKRKVYAESLTGSKRIAKIRKDDVIVRTNNAIKANNAVLEINNMVKKLMKEAKHEEILLRDTKKMLEAARKKLVSRASSRATSPTNSVRSTSSARSGTAKRLTANELNAKAANLRRRWTEKQARNKIIAEKKSKIESKKLIDAYKKLREFDEEVLRAFHLRRLPVVYRQ
jgi:hypothetical protein